MFQSLSEKCTQPIATFASNSSVEGEELAKLILKAVCLMDKIGVAIHGVIGDGPSTNQKMRKILGVTGQIDDEKTWFSHPLHDDHKVFIFFDTPHLFKCIRNRLYNKRQLRVNSDENFIKWEYFEYLYDVDITHDGNARACPKILKRHVKLDNPGKMRVRFATQIFSNSVAATLKFYLNCGYTQFVGCEETIAFCKRMNDMFDALNRKQPNQGLTPGNKDFKLLKEALEWLDNWEINKINKVIGADEFLTLETVHGLRITLRSTLYLCEELINNYHFKYLLTGKVNQDNLEKFFGTIRQAAGSNKHPSCPTFLQLYKLLSVYSLIKPPAYGNCSVSEKKLEFVIKIADIKQIF